MWNITKLIECNGKPKIIKLQLQAYKMQVQAVYVILWATVLLLLVTSDAVNGLKCYQCGGPPGSSCPNTGTCQNATSPDFFLCGYIVSPRPNWISPNTPGPESVHRGCIFSQRNAFVNKRMNGCATKAELSNGDVEDPGGQPIGPSYPAPFHYTEYCVCNKDLCNKDKATAAESTATTRIPSCLAKTSAILILIFVGLISKASLA